MFGQKVQGVDAVIATIAELQDDNTVPKNVKEKVNEILSTLRDEKAELSMRVDKALQVLDEIAEDSNLQSYTRTQIWSIVSMLEKSKTP